MRADNLRKHLLHLAKNVSSETRMEDIYEQVALLDDIDTSEEQERSEEVFTQAAVEKRSEEWLK